MANRKVLRILVWVFIIGLICAFSAIYYVFNMPRRNIAKENAAYTLTAQQLMSDFKKDESAANAKYLDKVIAVSGEIKGIRTLDNHSMVFSLEDAMEGVSCTIDSADVVKNTLKLSQLKSGLPGTFKGRCSGMLMDIQIINSSPE
ncbi:MAG: hypothetical protein WCP85_12265 [Mariniphaga sp.]